MVVDRLAEFLNEGHSFIVDYDENGTPHISEYKGRSTIAIDRELRKVIRRRRGKRRPCKKILRLVQEISLTFIQQNIPFKVIFGSNDVMVYIDLDHFIHIYPSKISIVGYKSLDDHPLNFIRHYLESYGSIKFLKPVK